MKKSAEVIGPIFVSWAFLCFLGIFVFPGHFLFLGPSVYFYHSYSLGGNWGISQTNKLMFTTESIHELF